MAMNQELRLKIATALDNAGIKATEQQIDGLAEKVQKINKEAGDKKLENALGGLQGKLGQIGKALGGIPAKMGLIIGAFQTGYEIGTKFFDTVVRGWFGWEDAVTKLKKANKSLQREIKASEEAFNLTLSKGELSQEKQIAKMDIAIRKIQEQTKAYTSLSQAKSRFDNSGEDMEIQRLERERFEDMIALQANGEYDRAEQVNKIYDIYRQELDAKKQLANYDEETLRFEEQRAAKEKEAFKWLEKVDKITEHYVYWQNQLKKLEEDDSLLISPAEYDKQEARIKRKIAGYEKQLNSAENEATKYMSDIDNAEYESLARERDRATLADKLNLDHDKLLWQYGQAVDQSGTSYGFNFSNDYIKQSFEDTQKSYTELHDIKENTQELAEKLDYLLSMK
jgi:hypothetical protein